MQPAIAAAQHNTEIQHNRDALLRKPILREIYHRFYQEIATNRAYFNEFDLFGDFDLLFGAAKLNVKIAGKPVCYKERTYGTTNIQRRNHAGCCCA